MVKITSPGRRKMAARCVGVVVYDPMQDPDIKRKWGRRRAERRHNSQKLPPWLVGIAQGKRAEKQLLTAEVRKQRRAATTVTYKTDGDPRDFFVKRSA